MSEYVYFSKEHCVACLSPLVSTFGPEQLWLFPNILRRLNIPKSSKPHATCVKCKCVEVQCIIRVSEKQRTCRGTVHEWKWVTISECSFEVLITH